ncbi:MAG: cyclase [Chloroflexi bacterium]|nr:cyclase [Chloroflexota bacterium]
MAFRHEFTIAAPRERVLQFHRARRSLAAITPPPIIVRIQAGPEVLSTGDELRFTLWLGPFPIRWHATIEAVSDAGFADRQLSGPFAHWVHRHTFIQSGENLTTVRDEIAYAYHRQFLWGLIGRLFVLGLPVLFAYRAWRTKRLIE